jgi:hypothetical protein
MNSTDAPRPFTWEPLTPRGVAAFARASWQRLLLVQFLVAALAAVVVVWSLATDWFPVVRSAIRQLPDEAELKEQTLVWPDDNPVQLAENHFLGLAVDLNHSHRLGHEAHVQLEFGRKDFRIISPLGYYRVVDYRPDWRTALSRTEVEPWWGAWEPLFLAGAAAVTILGLLVSWAILAALYWLPVWAISFLENRDLNWRESWRLAGAALMPGALFFTFAIFGYGLGWIDLMMLGSLAGLHLLIGWVYLFISPLFLPKTAGMTSPRQNPFQTPRQG